MCLYYIPRSLLPLIARHALHRIDRIEYDGIECDGIVETESSRMFGTLHEEIGLAKCQNNSLFLSTFSIEWLFYSVVSDVVAAG